ncbi:MAG: S-adenosylmethionine:tRNA ribosyltransferase-isomerase [Actinomycetota bacterium]|nr:S-adenosylmethionine:tRNA ribosyltransferase-isomerase [Actinomycetota bacterium]
MNAPMLLHTTPSWDIGDSATLDFELPPELEAGAPPPRRDAVRLLVAHRRSGHLLATSFRKLPAFLTAGDLLVVNVSATLPAEISGRRADGSEVLLHLSTPVPGAEGAPARWLAEARRRHGHASLPEPNVAAGEVITLPGGGEATLVRGWGDDTAPRLWAAELRLPTGLLSYLDRHGAPIRYRYTAGAWPLREYQTIYACEPGSAEMPSAGRPFTHELLAQLVGLGVGVAPLVLHAGVSSAESGEAPYPERFRVPAATAARCNAAHAGGHRVIAVGTTVVRALETVTDGDGRVRPGGGWTDLVVTPERGMRTVDGLLSGWHGPRASHLQLLEAVAGRDLLTASYAAALRNRYRWHEFGDAYLVLP